MVTLARKLYPINLTGQLKADQRLFSKYCYQAQDNKVNLTGKRKFKILEFNFDFRRREESP